MAAPFLNTLGKRVSAAAALLPELVADACLPALSQEQTPAQRPATRRLYRPIGSWGSVGPRWTEGRMTVTMSYPLSRRRTRPAVTWCLSMSILPRWRKSPRRAGSRRAALGNKRIDKRRIVKYSRFCLPSRFARNKISPLHDIAIRAEQSRLRGHVHCIPSSIAMSFTYCQRGANAMFGQD